MAARGGSRQREPLRGPRGKGSATQARTAPRAVSTDLDLAAAYNEYRPAILRYLRRRTGDVQLAEELMQDVFLAALVAQPSLSTARTPLLAWLYVVARRRAIDAARSARRTPRAAQAALDDVSVAYAVDDGRVSARAITDAISVLPAEEQRVVLLRLLRGCSFAEIGSSLGADAAVCRVRFSRALRALRESLGQAVVAALIAIGQLASEGLDAAGCGV
jgi:RNA polymerase sigma-70 factor (ECF subfamily)